MSSYMYDLCQIRPNSLVIYPYYEFDKKVKKDNKYLFWSNPNTLDNKTKGYLSENSKRKLKYAINLLIASAENKLITLDGSNYQVRKWNSKAKQFIELGNKSGTKSFKYKIGFLTLTLPSEQGIITDEQLKKSVLNHFLTDCRRYLNLRNYVWKAEVQENGNLHFHITTDCFLPVDVVRKFWNKAINKFGFVDQYRINMKNWHKEGFRVREDLLDFWPLESQIKAYDYGCKTNWSNPNTIDIHSVKKIRNMSAYLVDYMCKKEIDKRAIKGKIWGCSEKLTYNNKLTLDCIGDIGNDLNYVREQLEHKAIKSDFFTIIPYSNIEFEQLFSEQLKSRYFEFISAIRFNE